MYIVTCTVYILYYNIIPHSASYNIEATTTCASRVSVLVGHRKKPNPPGIILYYIILYYIILYYIIPGGLGTPHEHVIGVPLKYGRF